MVDPESVTTAVVVYKALDAAGPAVKDFTKRVAGSVGDQVGGLIADQVGYLRWRAGVKMLGRAQRFAEAQGVTVDAVPLKNFVPLLEGASLEAEEDDDMIDRWAQLLVTNMSSETPPGWADILRQLSPAEAKVLDWVYGASVLLPVQRWDFVGGKTQALCLDLGISNAEAGIVCDTLGRLGLAATPGVNDGRPDFAVAVSLTRSGYHFVNACRAPELAVVPPQDLSDELADSLKAHTHPVLTEGGIYWGKAWDRRVALRAFGFVR